MKNFLLSLLVSAALLAAQVEAQTLRPTQIRGVTSDTNLGTGGLVLGTSPTITTSIIPGGTSFDVFNTVATTVNAFGAASVALNIGNASAAAAFPGGVSIPTGKSVTGAGTAAITGFTSVAATTGTFTNIGGTLTTAAQTNITSVGTLAANLLFVDATYDIGASGATRPRDFFLSRNATIGGSLGVTGLVTVKGDLGIDTDANRLYLKSGGLARGIVITGSAAGNVTLDVTAGSLAIGNNRAMIFAGTGRIEIPSGKIDMGTIADRSVTTGTNVINVYNGTAPSGTLSNGITLYSSAGEAYIMDAAGNATLNSPHDAKTNEWIFRSTHTPTGKTLTVRMEAMMKALNDKFGWDFIRETYQ